MSNYARNKKASITHDKDRLLVTDQTAAHETDRNVIVHRFLQSGLAPGGARPPQYADFSGLPTDLRGFINQARSLAQHRNDLPPKLRALTTEQLLSLTPEELNDILKPDPLPDPPKPEPKEGK